MYTQCPKCTTAFRVSAGNLKQASGKVRCGKCGNAFNALLYLSESKPASAAGQDDTPTELPPGTAPGDARTPQSIYAEQSEALLKALDELAGPGVRMEDTGIEWRLLTEDGDDDGDDASAIFRSADTPIDAELDADTGTPRIDELLDDSPAPIDEFLTATPNRVDEAEVFAGGDDEPTEVLDDAHAVSEREIRFDDNTGVSDDELPDDGDTVRTDADDDAGPRSETRAGESAEAELVLGESEEWEELLDEVTIVDEPATEHPPGTPAGDGERRQPPNDDDVPELLESVQKGGSPGESRPAGAAHPADEFGTAAGTTALLRGDTLRESGGLATAERNIGVETIVMEGDTVRTSLEHEKLEAVAASMKDTATPEFIAAARETMSGTMAPDDEWPGGGNRGAILGSVLLALLLVGQVVHQTRAELATSPAMNRLIAPVYGKIGRPVTPAWDARGWRFESTRGNAAGAVEGAGASAPDSDVLTIDTRIGNQSTRALAYPLIVVSLTDRYEEVIGSTAVSPREYLFGEADPDQLVPAGNSFNATILVASPPDEATGFKLNACYRQPDGLLRCAVAAFR